MTTFQLVAALGFSLFCGYVLGVNLGYRSGARAAMRQLNRILSEIPWDAGEP